MPQPSSTSKLVVLAYSRCSKFLNLHFLTVLFFFLGFRSPPHIPEVHIPEEPVLQIAASLRIEINRALVVLRDIASGRDLKKFLSVS